MAGPTRLDGQDIRDLSLGSSDLTGSAVTPAKADLTQAWDFQGGLSGSLTKLSDGRSYLAAGTNVTITSGSGQVVISATASGSGSTGTTVNVGTTTIDFGPFPGASDAMVSVTGQTNILTSSIVNAWIAAIPTVDHSVEEHFAETIRITVGPVTSSVGFMIYAVNTNQIYEPVEFQFLRRGGAVGRSRPDYGVGGQGTRLYGQWSVAWQWI